MSPVLHQGDLPVNADDEGGIGIIAHAPLQAAQVIIKKKLTLHVELPAHLQRGSPARNLARWVQVIRRHEPQEQVFMFLAGIDENKFHPVSIFPRQRLGRVKLTLAGNSGETTKFDHDRFASQMVLQVNQFAAQIGQGDVF